MVCNLSDGQSKKVGEMAGSQSKDGGQSKKVGEMVESEDDGQSGQPQPKKVGEKRVSIWITCFLD